MSDFGRYVQFPIMFSLRFCGSIIYFISITYEIVSSCRAAHNICSLQQWISHLRRLLWTRFFIYTLHQRDGFSMVILRQVERVFAALRQQLGWMSRGGHDQPRIQDLRHTFAVRRVTLWQTHCIEIDQAMLALSTYMGHAKISNTYWYLTTVPELMGVAAGKFEQFTLELEMEDA